MKDNFKKFIILFAGIASPIGAYAISGAGIAAATLGSAAAVTILGVGIHNSRHKDDPKNKKALKKKMKVEKKDKKTEKQELRNSITEKKKELKDHRNDLRKLKSKAQGLTPEAEEHRMKIKELENNINSSKAKLESL